MTRNRRDILNYPRKLLVRLSLLIIILNIFPLVSPSGERVNEFGTTFLLGSPDKCLFLSLFFLKGNE